MCVCVFFGGRSYLYIQEGLSVDAEGCFANVDRALGSKKRWLLKIQAKPFVYTEGPPLHMLGDFLWNLNLLAEIEGALFMQKAYFVCGCRKALLYKKKGCSCRKGFCICRNGGLCRERERVGLLPTQRLFLQMQTRPFVNRTIR